MRHRRIVIAGGSAAGLAAASKLRALGYAGDIDIVDEDPQAPYRRPTVSKGLLTGVSAPDSVKLPLSEDLHARWHSGARLTRLETQERVLSAETAQGTLRLPFDGLVIATGCGARALPVPAPARGVFTLRGADDAVALRAALEHAEHVVVIGGGFVGLEAASSVRALGKSVTVIEAAERPLEHAVGRTAGALIETLHRSNGVDVVCGRTVRRLEGRETIEAVALDDGQRLPADVVVVSVGATPRVEWLIGSGIDIADGVRCDADCAVEGQQDIVAAGDIASWPNPLYGRRMRIEHWTNAVDQGAHAASRLLGLAPEGGFESLPYFWSDQAGARIQRVGVCDPGSDATILEQTADSVLVAFSHGGHVAGLVGVNAGAAVMRLRTQVRDRCPIADLTVGAR